MATVATAVAAALNELDISSLLHERPFRTALRPKLRYRFGVLDVRGAPPSVNPFSFVLSIA
jgi:hypothetical protein